VYACSRKQLTYYNIGVITVGDSFVNRANTNICERLCMSGLKQLPTIWLGLATLKKLIFRGKTRRSGLCSLSFFCQQSVMNLSFISISLKVPKNASKNAKTPVSVVIHIDLFILLLLVFGRGRFITLHEYALQ